MARVRRIFNTLGDATQHIWRLDGSRSIQEVHQTIISLFIENVLKEKRCAKSWGCDGLYCMYRATDTCDWVTIRRGIMAQEPMERPALIQ